MLLLLRRFSGPYVARLTFSDLQWIEAVIATEIDTRSALDWAADNYEGANFHAFVSQLRDAPTHDISLLELISTFCQGPAATKRPVSLHSASLAEVECMLHLCPEDAATILAAS